MRLRHQPVGPLRGGPVAVDDIVEQGHVGLGDGVLDPPAGEDQPDGVKAARRTGPLEPVDDDDPSLRPIAQSLNPIACGSRTCAPSCSLQPGA